MDQGVATRQERRAMAWLSRHGGGVLTPLLVARLAARRQGQVTMTVVGVASLVCYAVWVYGRHWRPGAGLVAYAVVGVAMSLASILGLLVQRRANRGVGAALPQRVARPAAVPVRAVLGRKAGVAAAVMYGGGLLVGVVGLATAADSTSRLTSVVVTGAVLVFAALMVVVLAEVVRRPTVAEDQLSLAYDAVLRREDVVNGIAPFPLFLAGLALTGATASVVAVYSHVAYVVVGFVVWLVAKTEAAYLQVRPARPTAGPTPERAMQ